MNREEKKGERVTKMDVVGYFPSNTLQRDLGFLTTLEPEVLRSFCKVALENLAGLRDFESKLHSVAGKFGIEPEVLDRAIESLAYLLTCMRKEKMRESGRKTFLEDLGFSEGAHSVVEDCYAAYLSKFEETTKPTSRSEAHFKSLDWRLDVQLDTRAGKNAPTAKYLVKLRAEDNNLQGKGTCQ